MAKSRNLLIAIFASGSVCAMSSMAADLNAPVVPKVTIKSEIKRGDDAAFRCLMKTHMGWPDFSSCLDEVLSAETQRNTISDPFRLGFYYRAYDSMSNIGKVRGNLRENGQFMQEEGFYYKTQGQLRKSLHLSENDICHALEIPTCTPLAPP
jgi:hypothetical protein